MADNTISVGSVEVVLASEIGMSSATMIKDAYLPRSGDYPPGKGQAGPDARVIFTRIVTRTPGEVIGQIQNNDPGRTTNYGTCDYFTVILLMSMRLGDPSTTRLINGMIGVAVVGEGEILTHSPKDKGCITSLIENGGDAITLSQDLVFSAPAAPEIKNPGDLKENRFEIPIGPMEMVSGTYSLKTGYSLTLPVSSLLEYQGILKNRHEVFFEIYPPMPPQDSETPKDVMVAVFSLIIRNHQNVPPALRVIIECRVKGELWGMIPLTGSLDLP
jgi:hypothetical protein